MKLETIKYILLVQLIFTTGIAAAQNPPVSLSEETSRQGMWYIIPEANLWFGSYTTVEASPQIAYHLTDRLSIGTGISYNFYKEIESYYSPGYSTHLFGSRAFSRLTILKDAEKWLPFYLFSDLFIHLEFQIMNLEKEYFYAPSFPDDGRFWSEQVYFGGGFTQNLSPMSSYSILLLWDLNRNIFSPFGNPVYRIGLNIYLGGRKK